MSDLRWEVCIREGEFDGVWDPPGTVIATFCDENDALRWIGDDDHLEVRDAHAAATDVGREYVEAFACRGPLGQWYIVGWSENDSAEPYANPSDIGVYADGWKMPEGVEWSQDMERPFRVRVPLIPYVDLAPPVVEGEVVT